VFSKNGGGKRKRVLSKRKRPLRFYKKKIMFPPGIFLRGRQNVC